MAFQRQAAQEFDVVILAHPLTAATTKDMLFVTAFRANMDAHVFNDAENRDIDLLEHFQALARVDQRDVLRRGNNDCASHRHFLRQR